MRTGEGSDFPLPIQLAMNFECSLDIFDRLFRDNQRDVGASHLDGAFLKVYGTVADQHHQLDEGDEERDDG